MRNAVVGVILVAIIGFGAYLLLSQNKTTNETLTTPSTSSAHTASSSAVVTAEITVSGSNYKFVPNEIKAKKGDTVKITFKDEAGSHDLQIPDFNTGTKVLSTGQQETIEFVVDKTGTFEYFCSVGNHRAMGMKGNLIVK